jgi:hypothetical protein
MGRSPSVQPAHRAGLALPCGETLGRLCTRSATGGAGHFVTWQARRPSDNALFFCCARYRCLRAFGATRSRLHSREKTCGLSPRAPLGAPAKPAEPAAPDRQYRSRGSSSFGAGDARCIFSSACVSPAGRHGRVALSCFALSLAREFRPLRASVADAYGPAS